MFADIAEGLEYLRQQPRVLALGITYACMMAGVISANVLVVALAKDLLSAGPRGYGYIEAGWAIGAIVGGLAAGTVARKRPYSVLILALATLAVGHTLFPFARVLAVAVAMNALFGVCRALGRRADAILDHDHGATASDGADAIGIFGDRDDSASRS